MFINKKQPSCRFHNFYSPSSILLNIFRCTVESVPSSMNSNPFRWTVLNDDDDCRRQTMMMIVKDKRVEIVKIVPFHSANRPAPKKVPLMSSDITFIKHRANPLSHI